MYIELAKPKSGIPDYGKLAIKEKKKALVFLGPETRQLIDLDVTWSHCGI